MVWTPDRQISKQAGEALMEQIERARLQDTKFRDINDLLERSIADLLRANPLDLALQILWESGAWVELQPVEWKVIPVIEEVG